MKFRFLNLLLRYLSKPARQYDGLYAQPISHEWFTLASTYPTRWRGSATGIALDLRSVGRGFKSCSRQRCVTTLGKLFTPIMCLCHQAV